MKSTISPWWYRRRALIMGLIYLVGFFGAALFDAIVHVRYVPVVDAVPWAVPVAVALVVASWALRVWGSSYLTAATVWSVNSLTGSLITGGPFAYTRNPLYLGNVLMALGIGAFAPPFGWLFINLAQMAFIVMLIRWEERGMRERHGDAFDAYCAYVPQFFPRLTPGAISSLHPSAGEGLRAEIFTGAILAGTIAISVDRAYGWAVFALLYIFGITAQTLLARRRASV
ncbi:MAG TPA: isoprenylcysteine carboxylmethyltransferase family protein [Candidatus Baltobacteraceae bacterium]